MLGNLKIKNRYRVFILILGVVLLLGLAGSFWLIQKDRQNPSLLGLVGSSLIKPVSAEEVYPLFLCPCCGQPLDKNNICCGMAKEMVDYIDSLTAKNLSQEEIILTFVKKYGLNAFANENKRNQFKEELVKAAPDERPIISLSSETYDFGDVSLQKGIITALFELKNEGKSDLIIERLDSSCGCTSATIIYKGEEGPRFAMAGHGTVNPTDWKLAVPPGESAQLKVYYDPSVHLDFRGPATREIYIYSNDPIDFEKKLTIELNQVD